MKDLQTARIVQGHKENAGWLALDKKNYKRSLDWQAVYFKLFDKKNFLIKNFDAEAENRFNVLIKREGSLLTSAKAKDDKKEKKWKESKKEKKKEEKPVQVSDMLQVFNSFQNVCKLECKHREPAPIDFAEANQQNYLNFLNKILSKSKQENYPIFILAFQNREVLIDALQFLQYMTSNQGTTAEKEKSKKVFKMMFMPLFGAIPLLEINNEAQINEGYLLSESYLIEEEIFEFCFSQALVEKTQETSIIEKPHHKTQVDREHKTLQQQLIQPQQQQQEAQSNIKVEQNGEFASNINQEQNVERKKLCKKMIFLEEDKSSIQFYPTSSTNTQFFYGTKNCYHLFRLFYALYERFLQVQIAQQLASSFDSPSMKTLSPERKEELRIKRYTLFKETIFFSIKQKFTLNDKLEDVLRNIFGYKGFAVFTLDKLFQALCKTILSIATDDLQKRINLLFFQVINGIPYLKNNGWKENVYYLKMKELAMKYLNQSQELNFFRFLYDPQQQLVYLSLFESPIKLWEKEKFEEMTAFYSKYQQKQQKIMYQTSSTLKRDEVKNLQSYQSNHLSKYELLQFVKKRVFMLRNLARVCKKYPDMKSRLTNSIQRNNIQFKSKVNSCQLISDNTQQTEDIYIFTKKVKQNVENKIGFQFEKATKAFKKIVIIIFSKLNYVQV